MEGEKKVFDILNGLRNYANIEDSFELIYILLSYKVMADIKHEKDYLRTHHLLEKYIEDIDFDKIKETNDLKELFKQMEILNILTLRCYNTINSFDKSISNKIIKMLEEIDFSKEIIRGNYNALRDNFFGIIEAVINDLGKITGEFTTPNLFGKIIKEVIDIKPNETLLDPCYGYGFLANIVGQNSKLILGQDISEKIIVFGKINSLIANKDSELAVGDSLKHPNFINSDVVVCNYPFGIKPFGLDILEYGHYKNLPVNNADYHFLTLSLNKMKDRGAIIVSDGALFRGSKEGEIRKNIINDNLIAGIISLPGGIFKHTGISTNIVFFNKNKTNKEVFMLDAKELFTKTRGGVDYSEESLQYIINTYKSRVCVEGFSRYVSSEELKNNDYVLTVNRYIDKPIITEKIDTKELIKELKTLEKEIKENKKETDEILKRLMEEID